MNRSLFRAIILNFGEVTDEEYIRIARWLVKNRKYVSFACKAVGIAHLCVLVITLIYIGMIFRLGYGTSASAEQLTSMAAGVILGIIVSLMGIFTFIAFRFSTISRTRQLLVKYHDLYIQSRERQEEV